ncbi:MAG: HEAT repeat domain-containing protein [Actinobacteria bacterium]|nr:HEAT repeat domain-containing protein [Actinomycetota bacterium]
MLVLSFLFFLSIMILISIGEARGEVGKKLAKKGIPVLAALMLASLVGVSMTMGGEPRPDKLCEISCQESNDYYRKAAAKNIAYRLDDSLIKKVEEASGENEKARDSLTVISKSLENIYKNGDDATREKAMKCMEYAPREGLADFLLDVVTRDPSREVRAAAAVALKKAGDESCAEPLVQALLEEQEENELTEAIIGCLDAFGNARAAQMLVDELRKLDDTKDAARVEMLKRAIAAVGEPSAPLLLDFLGGPRTATAESILTLVGRPALKYLEAHIDIHKDDQAIRGAACIPLFEIHLGEGGDVLAHMVNYLKRRDWNGAVKHVSVHYKTFIELGIRGSEYYLIDALNAYGNVSMGEDYLNCGCDLLDQAARAWGSRHGYIVVTGMGEYSGPLWGTR